MAGAMATRCEDIVSSVLVAIVVVFPLLIAFSTMHRSNDGNIAIMGKEKMISTV